MIEAGSVGGCCQGILKVTDRVPRRSEVVFESDQARIVFVGASQIEFLELLGFGVLDGLPKEPGHTAQIVEPLIGATILVNERPPVTQCENTGDRPVIDSNDPDG